MDGVTTIAVSSAASLVGGFLLKVLWDWFTNRGAETRAVTAVLLEKISRDIESIHGRLDKNFNMIYERLRQAELTIVKNNEQIEMMREK